MSVTDSVHFFTFYVVVVVAAAAAAAAAAVAFIGKVMAKDRLVSMNSANSSARTFRGCRSRGHTLSDEGGGGPAAMLTVRRVQHVLLLLLLLADVLRVKMELWTKQGRRRAEGLRNERWRRGGFCRRHVQTP